MIDNEQFIAECKKAKCSYKEYIVIGNKQIEVKAQLYQSAYKDTTFFGKFNLSYITFETENDIKYRNKNFDYYKVVNGVEQKIGHFYVTEVQDDDTNESVKVTAYDNGIKFLNPYSTNLDFGDSITLYRLLQDCCQTNGITLENESITNGDFIVDNNQFVNGETAGDVICAIAQISGNFAFINWKGNLELRFVVPTNETIEDYVELEDKRDTQPITCLQIGLSEVEGENVVRKDQALIEQYGENWLIINDNPLVYTPAKRIAVIDNIFNKVKGFGYSSFVAKETFDHYRELGDLVTLKNKNGDSISSIVLRISTDYDAVTLEAPSITNAEVDYLYIGPDNMVQQQTKIQVDKANQKIESLITNTSQNTENISSLTQTVSGFDARISQASTDADNASNKVAQLSVDVSSLRSEIGEITDTTVHEKGYGSLEFHDINQSYPVQVKIHPMADSDIAYLYPCTNLFPSNTRYLKNRKLRFTNTQTNEIWEYILPDNLRYYNANIYDEFIMDFGTGGDTSVCQITKKVDISADGTKSALVTEEITQYSFPLELTLTDGDYVVELLGYPNAYLDVTLMSKNMYTSQFTTKVEMNSKITQKADEITTEVQENYATIGNVQELSSRVTQNQNSITSEVTNRQNADNALSSRITQTADSLTSEITNRQNGDNALSSRITQNTNNIETKVSKGSIVSTINQSAEAVKINANKISLEGKEINLTADNTTIKSTNFNVDKNGNLSCVGGAFTNGNILLTSDALGKGRSNFKITRNGGYVTLQEFFNGIKLSNDSAGISIITSIGNASNNVIGGIDMYYNDAGVLSISVDETGVGNIQVGIRLTILVNFTESYKNNRRHVRKRLSI